MHRGPIKQFELALKGYERGWRHIFRELSSKDFLAYYDLCFTLDFLGIDVLRGRTLARLTDKLKGKNEIAGKRRKAYLVTRARGERARLAQARKAAFRLMFWILVVPPGSFDWKQWSSIKDSVFHTVLWVVSHREVFGTRVARVVYQALEKRFDLSCGQERVIMGWLGDKRANGADECFSDEEDEGDTEKQISED